jgi:hypothetical protein
MGGAAERGGAERERGQRRERGDARVAPGAQCAASGERGWLPSVAVAGCSGIASRRVRGSTPPASAAATIDPADVPTKWSQAAQS